MDHSRLTIECVLLLSKIFHIVPRGFVQANAVEFSRLCYRGQVRCQDFPHLNHQVLAAGQFALHKVHIQVNVLMVQFIDHLPPDHGAQLLKVNNEAGIGIRIAFYRHNEVKIMPVPVFIRTGAEHLAVFFLAPGGIVEFVGGVEMFFSGNVEH